MSTQAHERPQASEVKVRLERIAEVGAAVTAEEGIGDDLMRLFSEDLDDVWRDIRMKIENNGVE